MSANATANGAAPKPREPTPPWIPPAINDLLGAKREFKTADNIVGGAKRQRRQRPVLADESQGGLSNRPITAGHDDEFSALEELWIVECATDNPTRTVASVRAAFSKHGGNLGSTGSVAFQFRKMGVFRLHPEGIDHDDLELYLIDHGLDEMGDSTGDKGEPQIVARCEFPQFGHMQEALEKRGIHPISAAHEYVCTTPVELPEAQATEVLEMVDLLEQNDDVQHVYHSLA